MTQAIAKENYCVEFEENRTIIVATRAVLYTRHIYSFQKSLKREPKTTIAAHLMGSGLHIALTTF